MYVSNRSDKNRIYARRSNFNGNMILISYALLEKFLTRSDTHVQSTC